MSTEEPEFPAIFTAESPEPDESVGELDLRGLRGHVAYDEERWPSLVFWDIEGTKIEFTAGICGWPAWRELAAEGAEQLAAAALAFAEAIRGYRLCECRSPGSLGQGALTSTGSAV